VKINRAKISAGKNKPPPRELLVVAYFYLEFMMARIKKIIIDLSFNIVYAIKPTS